MRPPILSILPVTAVALVSLGAAACKKEKAAASGAAGGGMVIQAVAVEARRQPVSESLALIGNIVANEVVEIKAETEGIVEEIHFSEGQRVEKGTLILKLDETKLAASLAQAEANYKLAQSNFERAKQLFHDKLISQQDYDQTASSFAASAATTELVRRQLKDARVYAPFTGITGARMVSPGQVVARSTTLTWLVDLDTVKVEVKVPEKYLRQVQAGRRLEFKVAAYPDETFRGEVYFVSPQLDESTRRALVKARIPNPDLKLKAGMFAELNLTLRLKDDALVIPEPALMSNGDDFSVFAIDSKSNAIVRRVQVGLRLPGKAEVLSGLTAGERVVVEGQQKLRPGAAVRFAPPEAAAPYLDEKL